jgi:hypothetical protein
MRSLTLVAVLVLAESCGASDWANHRATWDAKGPHSYQYVYDPTGFEPGATLRVTVQERAVVRIELAGVLQEPFGMGFTIEELFADLQRRLGSGGSCVVRSTYDATLGFPTSVYSDCHSEGGGWTATELEAR